MVVPAEQIERRGAPLTPEEAFDLFAFGLVASDYGLSTEELRSQMGSDSKNARALQIQKDIDAKKLSLSDDGD
jgi:hypothetical protein